MGSHLYHDTAVVLRTYKLGEAEYRGKRFADFAHDVKGNNELLVLTQPAHLQRQAGREMEPAERNLYRAQVVRERLVAAERETGENRSS